MFSLEHLTATERHLVTYLEAPSRPGAQSPSGLGPETHYLPALCQEP